ncbi:hypothetical protein V8D89_009854 [Ganoderma adspersum]
MLGLLVGLYGMLTILSVMSCYALLTQANRKSQPTVIILGLTIFTLFASTTTYLVASILYYESTFIRSFATGGLLIWSYGDDSDIPSALNTVPMFEEYTIFQSCTSAATLTINVLLGDAIVCWRICVVWSQNRAVKAICGVFLLATLIVGAIDTTQSCQLSKLDTPNFNTLNIMGTLFEGIPIGIAVCVLSLITNLLGTLLVAYKAWQSRTRLKRYFGMGSRTSQVQKLLSLLVESGALYCALWAVVVAFQVANLNNNYLSETLHPMSRFVNVFGLIANGALIPLIAIYPAIIIVFVALNKSHMEKGLTQHLESLPTPHITFSADRIAVSRHDESSHEEPLVNDEEGLRHTGSNTLEDTNLSRREEPKMEGIA